MEYKRLISNELIQRLEEASKKVSHVGHNGRASLFSKTDLDAITEAKIILKIMHSQGI